jgi:DNA polymerase-1
MIRMPAAIKGLPARMILQVHDELIFEVATESIQETIVKVKEVMENASEPVVKLKIPLVVEAGFGSSWAVAH